LSRRSRKRKAEPQLVGATSTRGVSADFGQIIASGDLGAMSTYVRGLDGQYQSSALSDPYRQVLTAFTGMRIVGQLLARIPAELWDTRKDEPVTSGTGTRGELLQLLKKPNAAQDWSTFIETAIIQYHSGQAYFNLFRPNAVGIPEEIRLIPPTRVRPWRERGDDPYVLRGWAITSLFGGNETVLPYEQVMRLQFASTEDPHVGISPFVAGRIMAESDYLAGVYQCNTMRNGGAPGAILSYDGGEDELPAEDARALEDAYSRRHGRPDGAGRIAIMTKKWSYQALGFRPRDIEFLSLKKFSVEEWARALLLPPLYLAHFDQMGWAEAGITEQAKFVYKLNIIPLAKKWASVWNTMLISKADPDLELVFNFDHVEALQEDMGLRADVAKKYIDMFVPLEQVNERFDLGFDMKRIPWADQAFSNARATAISLLVPPGSDDDSNAAPVLEPQQVANALEITKAIGTGELTAGAAAALLEAAGLPPHVAKIVAEESVPAAPPEPKPEPVPPQLAAAQKDQLPPPTAAPGEQTPEEQAPPPEEPAQRAIALRAAPKRPPHAVLKRTLSAFAKLHGKYEKKLAARVSRTINGPGGMRSRVLALVSKLNAKKRAPGDEDDPVDLSNQDIDAILAELSSADLARAIRPTMRDAYLEGTGSHDEVMESIGVPVGDLMSFQRTRLPQLADNYVDARLGTGYPTRVTDDLRAKVGDVITEAMNDGWNLRDTVQGIRDAFNGEASISRARNIARTETAMAMGSARNAAYRDQGVEKHGWMTAGDEHVRDDHAALEGAVVDVGEEFGFGLKFPGDPDADISETANCRCCDYPVSRNAAAEAEGEEAA
jgi:HK97 family phage portal protein